MKAINESFKQSGEYQEDGLYLFVIGDKASESGTEGDMPLGSQFGYLFPDATIRTIAHEVGHGAFNLEHPFDRPGRSSFGKGDLDGNLMEYGTGTELVKIQWDQTRAPGHVIGLFQTDKSGQLSIFGGVSWLGDLLGGLAKDAQEKEIEKLQGLLNHVLENYADYFENSKGDNIDITVMDYKDWSVRKSSHSGKIAKSIFTKFNAKQDNTITLHDKGIYMEEYSLEDKTYKVAIYSTKSTVELKNDKIRLKGYKELANHKFVKSGYTDKYGIIVLYDASGKFQMLLQVSGSDSPEKIAEQWLNYLAIVVASDEQEKFDKDIWGKIEEKLSKLLTKEELPKVWEEKEAQKESNNLKIEYKNGVNQSVITSDIEEMLYRVFSNAKINRTMIITSTLRSPEGQVQAMINNIKSRGIQSQKALYNSKGDLVIDYYVSISHLSSEEIIRLMIIKMQEVEFGSAHCDWKKKGAIDFGTNSNQFNTTYASDVPVIIEQTMKESKINSNQVFPPSQNEPALHIEVKLTN